MSGSAPRTPGGVDRDNRLYFDILFDKPLAHGRWVGRRFAPYRAQWTGLNGAGVIAILAK